MDAVIRGNTITREAHYFLDGNLTDPALPRVTIKDALGVAQVQDAVPTRIGLGIYQYTYPVPGGATLGIWSALFQGSIGQQALGPVDDPFEVLPVGSIAPAPVPDYTYDISTDIGKVRLLTDDRDMSSVSTALPLEQRSAVFSDTEIQTFLTMSNNDVFRAAAKGLITIANNRSLLVQSRRVGKAELDYGGVRKDLLASAEALITQSISQPADGYAEQVWDDYTMRRVVLNVTLRQSA
jgi:hypothetical protein